MSPVNLTKFDGMFKSVKCCLHRVSAVSGRDAKRQEASLEGPSRLFFLGRPLIAILGKVWLGGVVCLAGSLRDGARPSQEFCHVSEDVVRQVHDARAATPRATPFKGGGCGAMRGL